MASSNNITLSAGVRQNLLSLQNTAQLMSQTQNRLATGKKVNSALDNATNFFTAQSLQSRAADMASLLDNMTSGIKTLEAADNGLSAITKTVESMQSTLRQARQDKSFKTESYTLTLGTPAGTEELSFSGGAIGSTPVDVALTTNTATAATDSSTATNLTATTQLDDAAIGVDDGDTFVIYDGTTTVTFTAASGDDVQALIDAINGSGPLEVTASLTNGAFTLTADDNTVGFTVSGTGTFIGIATQAAPTAVNTAKSVDTLVSEINGDTDLQNKVRATNDNGRLRLENLSTEALDIDGITAAGVIDGTTTDAASISGNTVRTNLVKQFNELRDQLDKMADDASYNGVNLLRGDLLKLTFNETGTSTIEIQAKDEDGDARAINSGTLAISTAENSDFDTDTGIDGLLDELSAALGVLRTQSSSFGSNLSIVENRTEFSKAMINTLQTGADSLVLADTNEEAANMLALQTRQQLSSTALSLASQADQAVLRLF
jgi:flagellin-like hook-associated protein FlgL